MNVISTANLCGVERAPQLAPLGGFVSRRSLPVLLTLLALLASSPAMDAQIIRRPPQTLEPPYWVGVSIGLAQASSVHDGTTDSQWQFGTAAQYRATLEKRLQAGLSIGVSAGFATVPLTYSGISAGCAGGCDAKADIMQLHALFHAGSGMGLHQVVELGLGATGYSNFRTEVGGTKLAPTAADYDLSFAFGYGFGYGLSPKSAIEVVQEFGTAIHQRTGLAGGESSLPRLYTTRIGVRFGF
jgi:hypothetical protein